MSLSEQESDSRSTSVSSLRSTERRKNRLKSMNLLNLAELSERSDNDSDITSSGSGLRTGRGSVEEFEEFMQVIQNSSGKVSDFEEKWADIDFGLEDNDDNIMLVNENLFADHYRYRIITVAKLVEKLTSADSDSFLSKDFLRIHNVLLTSEELMILFKLRFLQVAKNGSEGELDVVGLRMFNLIKLWISQFFGDWYESLPMKLILDELCSLAEKHDLQKYSTLIISVYNRKKDTYAEELSADKKLTRNTGEPPEPELPQKLVFSSFLDLSSLEIARQLTLIDYVVLHSIKYKEIVRREWLTKTKLGKTCGSALFLKNASYLTLWVPSEILQADSNRTRVTMVQKFIEIIEELLKLKNFNSSMAIYNGLRSMSVTRLEDIWVKLKTYQTKQMEDYKALFTSEDNYKKLRKEMDDASHGPCSLKYIVN
eukprot:TRINITY_DN5687_c0_g1_i2.p1 TRINITY_DN5687_c0_g1~~TRINITY_DN5687_c0_g1_i2.p1  ORF type:complete len:436 (+),score=92.44 TRINITY_DN5687_c0_g1_i2:30-1310(+)